MISIFGRLDFNLTLSYNIHRMPKQNFGYDLTRVYPGLFSQILIDITQEMEEIKTKAKRGDFNGIYEHLAIINNIICGIMNEKLDLVKIIPEEK